ncbi:MAG: FoF1 ATP synthase subunit delta [Alphaproteobacteria bacterium]
MAGAPTNGRGDLAQAGQTSEAAERYAGAAFELAEESKALEAVEKDLATFAEAIATNPDLRTAAISPLIAPEEKSRALVAVAEKLGLSKLGANLIGLAAANGRAGDIEGIACRVSPENGGKAWPEGSGNRPRRSSSTPRRSKPFLHPSPRLSARAVQPTTRVDPSLIGGFIVRAGSRQFDASVKSKLDNLKLALRTQ